MQQQAIGAGINTVSRLPSGSYVVKVQVDNNTHVSQVIKLQVGGALLNNNEVKAYLSGSGIHA